MLHLCDMMIVAADNADWCML